jgi:type 1 glutamine amidotransferase
MIREKAARPPQRGGSARNAAGRPGSTPFHPLELENLAMRLLRPAPAAAAPAVVLAAAVWAACCTPAFAGKRDWTSKIAPALPGEAAVKPKQPRKLLVFNTRKGHALPAEAAAKAMELMGEKTGAWTATVSDDPAVFEADSLTGFDAVCINNTSGFNPFGDPPPRTATREEQAAAAAVTKRREEALLAFVRGGKGVIGFHGTTDSRSAMLFELFHGRFNGHPWLGNEKTTVRVDDPKHALTRSFAGEPFEIVDEIYQFTDTHHADFRKHVRVLLTLDMTKTPPKGSRADQDYAVAWVKKVGEGRLFYCSLGHNPEIFHNPRILRFYQDGIQFALGDLEADIRPSGEAGIQPPPAPAPPSKAGR